ncbi:hypothetical protein [Piscirickettsia salmonis]|uniref:hypothetical protein n=1 Tax=Piscirickettsia salmonis TaxID=1238 RepID=UPI0012B92246|nr:hypothetical protein [Piscirickettsia salmonis]
MARGLAPGIFIAITFLNDKKESSKAKSDIEEVVVDECNDQAKLIKNYKEPQYSF